MRINFPDWEALKPKTPFGQLPYMNIDDAEPVAQSAAMLRYASLSLAPSLARSPALSLSFFLFSSRSRSFACKCNSAAAHTHARERIPKQRHTKFLCVCVSPFLSFFLSL